MVPSHKKYRDGTVLSDNDIDSTVLSHKNYHDGIVQTSTRTRREKMYKGNAKRVSSTKAI